MEKLKGKISEENYEKLFLFFANTNLDEKQRNDLLGLIENIRVDKTPECCSEEGCNCGSK